MYIVSAIRIKQKKLYFKPIGFGNEMALEMALEQINLKYFTLMV